MDDEQTTDAPGGDDALSHTVAGVRRLIELAVTADPPADALAAAADHVARAIALLEPFRTGARRRAARAGAGGSGGRDALRRGRRSVQPARAAAARALGAAARPSAR